METTPGSPRFVAARQAAQMHALAVGVTPPALEISELVAESNMEVIARWPVMPSKEAAPTKCCAEALKTGTTAWPCLVKSDATSQAL